MFSRKKILTFVLVLTVGICQKAFTMDQNNPYYDDHLQIARIVSYLQLSVQLQRPQLVVNTLDVDTTMGKAEMTDMEDDVKNLCTAFDRRTAVKKPNIEGFSFTNTWDFTVHRKSLSFSYDRKEAWLDLSLGFSTMYHSPTDSMFVRDLTPAEQLAFKYKYLDAKQKMNFLKYRPVRLHLVKKGSCWKIKSISAIKQYFRKVSNIYQKRFDREFAKKTKG